MERAERQSCAGGGLWGSPPLPGDVFPCHLAWVEAPLSRAGGEKLASYGHGGPVTVGMGFALLYVPAFAGDIPQAGGRALSLVCTVFPMESSQYLIFPGA